MTGPIFSVGNFASFCLLFKIISSNKWIHNYLPSNKSRCISRYNILLEL